MRSNGQARKVVQKPCTLSGTIKNQFRSPPFSSFQFRGPSASIWSIESIQRSALLEFAVQVHLVLLFRFRGLHCSSFFDSEVRPWLFRYSKGVCLARAFSNLLDIQLRHCPCERLAFDSVVRHAVPQDGRDDRARGLIFPYTQYAST